MIVKKIIKPKFLITALFTVMALVAFNLGSPTLHNNLQSSFNEWYRGASEKLLPSAELKETDLSLQVSILVRDPSHGTTPSVWQLPTKSLLDPVDRENTGRVLQLLSESGIFGLSSVRDQATSPSLMSVTVKDAQKQFEIAVPLEAVQENIQLRNLLKLLQVYSSTPSSSEVTPERL
jgi:hypothetical protein